MNHPHLARLNHEIPSCGGTTRTGDCKCREVKLDFAKRDEYRPVLLELSLAENLVKPLLSLYGTEWRERGYGFRK